MNIDEFYINENDTVIQAMKALDELAMKILFIQKNGKLQAALSDGDIRRWILTNGDLYAPIKKVANYNPYYLVGVTNEQAIEFLKEKCIDAVPILDNESHILDIVIWNSKQQSIHSREQINLPVIMMAGGKGTRLYPYTKILPKPLIPIGDIPIAEHIIREFRLYGCKDFYLIINHKKNMIKAYFNEIEKDYNVTYVDEEIPLGTGGGLCLLKGKITETFILTNCDILVQENFAEIYHYHKSHHNVITMVCSLKNMQIPYGVVHIGNDGKIESLEEKPSMSFFTNTGCYIVEPEVIESLEDGKEIGFPDIIQMYHSSGQNVGIFPIGENSWMDMGQMDELEKMKQKMDVE